MRKNFSLITQAKGGTVQLYCSHNCFIIKKYEQRPDLYCKNCGEKIHARGKNRKYCSMNCRNQSKLGVPSHLRKNFDDYPDPIRDPDTGCLRWQGPHHSNGYGRLKSKEYAHRFIWIQANGEIPDGMTIDHVRTRGCIYRDCIEISHLELVTQSENTRRSEKIINQNKQNSLSKRSSL